MHTYPSVTSLVRRWGYTLDCMNKGSKVGILRPISHSNIILPHVHIPIRRTKGWFTHWIHTKYQSSMIARPYIRIKCTITRTGQSIGHLTSPTDIKEFAISVWHGNVCVGCVLAWYPAVCLGILCAVAGGN